MFGYGILAPTLDKDAAVLEFGRHGQMLKVEHELSVLRPKQSMKPPKTIVFAQRYVRLSRSSFIHDSRILSK
jgi:hypothetical protein